MSRSLSEQLRESAAEVLAHTAGRTPLIGLVLGSGLGGFAEELEDSAAIPFAKIPHLPSATVVGHAGRLVIGTLDGVTCAALQGRIHGYEGHSAAAVSFPARLLITLGAQALIITNAAGGLRPEWDPGTLMLISDHINLTGDNPLRGHNDEHLGPRFPDMTTAYDPRFRELAKSAAARIGVPVTEGVYAGLSGPSYETPAEIRMLTALGADAVGMSTVFEVIVARHMGARVLGISCITNKAAGITGEPLSHEDVTATAVRVRADFTRLLRTTIADMARELSASGSTPNSAPGDKDKDRDRNSQ